MRASASPPRACHCCGLVQDVPHVPPRHRALCARCGVTIWNPARRARSHRRTAAAALAALILYPLALSLPIMRLDRFGHQTEASIWSGSIGLLQKGELFVGIVVLVCSVVLPLFKLAGLLAITAGGKSMRTEHRALTYRLIESC